MKQIAQVVRKDGRLVGRLERSEACMKCRACDYGMKAESVIELPAGEWHEGDEVEIDLDSGKFSQAFVLAYGVPLLGLIAGLLIGGALPAGEIVQALLGVLGAALGFGLLRALEPRLKAFRPRVSPCSGKQKGE